MPSLIHRQWQLLERKKDDIDSKSESEREENKSSDTH